jgi:type II secretory pathway component PulC
MSKEAPKPSSIRSVALLAILLVIALGAVVFSWRRTHAPAPSASPAGSPADVSGSALAQEAERLSKSVRARLDADAVAVDVSWRPAAAPAPVAVKADVGRESFKLKGVARDGTQPVAFIDDRTVGLGEEIEGYRLIEIGNESVTFLDPKGRRYVIGLYGGE